MDQFSVIVDNLTGVALNKANLKYAKLRGCNLTAAKLNKTKLNMATLSQAKLPRASLSDADLSHANLAEACLSNAYLFNAKLSNANLGKADLHSAVFESANLEKANLHGACLYLADLIGADLNQANLHAANLMFANLMGAKLNGPDLSEAVLVGANIRASDLSGALLDRTNLSGIYLPTWDDNNLDYYLNHINNNNSLLKTIDSIEPIYNKKKIALVHQLIDSLDKRPTNVSLSSVVHPLLETFAKAPYNQDQKIINWLNNKILPSYLAKYAVSTMPVLTTDILTTLLNCFTYQPQMMVSHNGVFIQLISQAMAGESNNKEQVKTLYSKTT